MIIGRQGRSEWNLECKQLDNGNNYNNENNKEQIMQILKNLKRFVVALVVGLAAMSGGAETAAQLVWSQQAGCFYVYIDENGVAARASDSFTYWRDVHGQAVMVNGRVYAPRIITSTGVSEIELYDSGAVGLTLPTVTEPGATEICAATVTPDGRWLFMLTFRNLWRYDLSEGSEGEWVVIDSDVNYVPRGLCADEAGNIYYALRNTRVIRCRDAATGALRWSFTQSSSYGGPIGVCWNPIDNYLYWTNTGRYLFRMPANGDSSKWEVNTTANDGSGGWAQALCVVNGEFYMNYYNAGGNGRITRFNWEPGEDPKNFTYYQKGEVDGNACGLTAEILAPTAHWRFLEPANRAVVANAINPGVNDIVLRKSLRTGAYASPAEYGVKAGAAYFAGDKAYAVIANSSALIPAIGDFGLTMAVGLGAEKVAIDSRLFSNCPLGAEAQAGSLEILTDANDGSTLVLRYVNAAGAEQLINGSKGLGNGEWHNVGVRRSGTALELYLDGELIGSGTIAANDAIGNGFDWHIGAAGDESWGYLGADAFVGEIKLFTESVYAQNFAHVNHRAIYAALPECPEAPTDWTPMPAAFGTEVAHVFAAEGSAFAAPTMFVAANGDYFLAVDGGERQTQVYTSTDQGESWTMVGEDEDGLLPMGAVSFFEREGKLLAFGQSSAMAFSIYEYDADPEALIKWNEVATVVAEVEANYLMSPGAIAFAGNRIIKPVVKAAEAFTAGFRLYWATFVDEGEDGIVPGAVVPYDTVNPVYGPADVTVREVLPGHAFHLDTYTEFLSPLVQAVNPALPALPPEPDSAFYWTVSYHWEPELNPYGLRYNCNNRSHLRTGNGLFGAVYDAVTKRTYVLAVADGKLMLQASAKLPGWMPCAQSVLPGNGTVLAPSIAIDGDDLVVAMGVRAEDGCGGESLVDGANFIAFRRLANFRSCQPEAANKYSARLTYAGGSDPESLSQLWKAADGFWYQNDYLKRKNGSLDNAGTYMVSPMGVNYIKRQFYALCSYMPYLFVLNSAGTPVKRIALPDAAKISGKNWWSRVVADRDGRQLVVFVGDAGLYRLNPEDDSFTTILEYTDADWDNPNAVAVATDGTVYTASYSGIGNMYSVRAYLPGGAMEKLVDKGGSYWDWSAFAGAVLDPDEQTLYLAQCNGTIRKLDLADLATRELTTLVALPGNNSNKVRGMWFGNGKLYTHGTQNGRIYEVDPTSGAYTVVASDSQIFGLTWSPLAVPTGFKFFIY